MDFPDIFVPQRLIFKNRSDAGKKLAAALGKQMAGLLHILALPRGGVPVGYEVARRLHAPLDVLVARKVGAPATPELGIGAVSENGVTLLDGEAVTALSIPREKIGEMIESERQELIRRVRLYRSGRPLPSLTDCVAVLVDDGLATGVTAEASILAAEKLRPKRLVFAAPVCAADTAGRLRGKTDGLVCLHEVSGLRAVGHYYRDFSQVSDREVIMLLEKSGV